VGWMCALRTASPDWHSFARWSWSEATAPSNKLTGGRRVHSTKFSCYTNLHFVTKSQIHRTSLAVRWSGGYKSRFISERFE